MFSEPEDISFSISKIKTAVLSGQPDNIWQLMRRQSQQHTQFSGQIKET